jgi:hypothetical protein
VNVRVAVLPVGSALVLAAGLYLLNAVRAEPRAVTAAATPSVAAVTPVAQAAAREGSITPPDPSAAPPPAPMIHRGPPPGPPPVAPPAAEDGSGDSGNGWGGRRHHRHRDGDSDEAAGSSADPKLDQLMTEANHAYDRGDLEDARKMAQQILADHPDNARMLRVMVSSYCIDGDTANATSYFQKLPVGDQGQMRRRCDRYGVTFPQ